MRLLVLNGPNLDLLGKREPEVYGSTTLAQLEQQLADWADRIGVEVEVAQSNAEDALIEAIHDFDGDGIVINPGAFTHTSRAIGDAIAAVPTPVVEVHVSDVHGREPWRAVSVISDACVRTIYGRGLAGYRDALRHLVNRAAWPLETNRYGPHRDNVGDLRRAEKGLVVLAHGGLWRGEYERDLMESLAVDLARRGIHTWNVEYRRTGRGGGWPASGHDVLTALDHVPQLGLDNDRTVIVGHSAGSHLLMWAAARTATPIALHVALAPLLDLEAAVADGAVGAEESRAMLEGGAPTRMTPEGVDTVFVHGEADEVVPHAFNVALARDLGVELHSSKADHFSLLDPSKPDWSWGVARITDRL